MGLGRALSLGVLALGVGLVSWALVGIAQPIDSLSGYPGSPAVAQSTATAAGTPSQSVRTAALAYPKVGNKLGSLYIPKIAQRFPIVEGTSSTELKRGVGHFRGSALPGGNDNCVLSGHRDTVFTKLGRVKKGDRIVVTTAAGTFTYRVRLTRIVKASDKTVVVHTAGAVLTVTTCYPFGYVGNAPKRFVVVADLIGKK
jgi:sortase A